MTDGLLEAAEARIEMLEDIVRENLVDKLMKLEDIGWTPLSGHLGARDDDSGVPLDTLHDIIPRLRDEAATNPMHIRGSQLRHSYVFGRGIYFTNLGKAEEAVKNVYNQESLFSVQAFKTNNLALFTDGNLIVLREERTNLLTVVPLGQIQDVGVDPDDNAKIRYIKRTWVSNGKEKNVWYPLARFKNTRVGRGKRRGQTGGIQKSFTQNGKSVPVSQDTVAYVHTSNRQSGWTWGLPDSLGALIWSTAYREYLSDNAKLVKSLSMLAWKVTAATKTGADNAAATVKLPGGTGGSAVVGQGNDVTAVSRGSDVNFNNGQPLAAMVAASFGVPVIALLSSPGATGGSYGAASTLDEPTLKGMKAVQDSWVVFYRELLADMGAVDPEVSFPNISQDETFREVQSLATSFEAGAIFDVEFRDAILDLLDVRKAKEGVPTPPAVKTMAAQGKTGAVPGGQNQNVGDHGTD